MGIYDRDYFRDDDPKDRRRKTSLLPSGLSGVALLVALNVALYFVNQATGGALFERTALSGDAAANPLQWYRCLTYGFAHDPSGLMHILCNMIALFFFGPPIERRCGRREFLAFYLAAVVAGGIVWNALHVGDRALALGASGAISAVVVLFAFYYPHARVLIFGIIPTPAWLAGVGFVLYDAYGARSGAGYVAHDVHLAGAAFAAIYYWLNLRISEGSFGRGRRKKTLKIFRGGASIGKKRDERDGSTTANSTVDDVAFDRLEAEVDRLLLQISEKGEESLTESERETLRRASREYQKRQKKD